MKVRIVVYNKRSTLRSLLAEMQSIIDGLKDSEHLDNTVNVLYDDVSGAPYNSSKIIFNINENKP
jgi:hypothetical protein